VIVRHDALKVHAPSYTTSFVSFFLIDFVFVHRCADGVWSFGNGVYGNLHAMVVHTQRRFSCMASTSLLLLVGTMNCCFGSMFLLLCRCIFCEFGPSLVSESNMRNLHAATSVGFLAHVHRKVFSVVLLPCAHSLHPVLSACWR
jgi:hypothetical protein